MDKERLIREFEARRGSWQAFLLVYGLLIAAMILSGLAIT